MGKDDSTKVLPCSCKHAYQDSAYGKQMRVHNYGPKAANKAPGWRCTVCAHERGE